MRIDVLASGTLTAASDQGVVRRWLVKVGDRVARDAVLAEVETDKANLELTAPESGVVEALLAKEGDTFERTTVLARIVTEGEPVFAEPSPPPVTAPREESRDRRCAFCRTLRVAGRVDCIRCGAPY